MESVGDQPYVELNNGVKMPQIGLGTFTIKSEAERSVFKAAIMEVGYRHLDTASFYENEAIIGEVLKECFAEGLKREDIFITTKLFPSQFEDPLAAFNTSLQKLQLDYIDQYLIHVPINLFDA